MDESVVSEMIERVARAFLADLVRQGQHPANLSAGYVASDEPLSELTIDGRFDLGAATRAAIAAMREPDDQMLEAGELAGRPRVPVQNGVDQIDGLASTKLAWAAMIRQALAD